LSGPKKAAPSARPTPFNFHRNTTGRINSHGPHLDRLLAAGSALGDGTLRQNVPRSQRDELIDEYGRLAKATRKVAEEIVVLDTQTQDLLKRMMGLGQAQ
jgi:hypothetical protein